MCAYLREIYVYQNLTVTNTAFVQVGINYNFNAELETLQGCVNDARNFYDFLKCRFYGFRTIRSPT